MHSGRHRRLWLMQQRSAQPPLLRSALVEELVYRVAIGLGLTSILLGVAVRLDPGFIH
jgi:hypothetical protein